MLTERTPRTYSTALIGSDGSSHEAITTCHWDPANAAVPGYVAETAAAMANAQAARYGGQNPVKYAAAAGATLVEDDVS